MGTRKNRPIEAVLTSTHSLCFKAKIMYTPCETQFCYIKWGVWRSSLHEHVILMSTVLVAVVGGPGDSVASVSSTTGLNSTAVPSEKQTSPTIDKSRTTSTASPGEKTSARPIGKSSTTVATSTAIPSEKPVCKYYTVSSACCLPLSLTSSIFSFPFSLLALF